MNLVGNDIIYKPGQNLTEIEGRVLYGLAEGETPTKIKQAIKCDSPSLRDIEIKLMRKLGAKTKTHIVSRGFTLNLLLSRSICLMLALILIYPANNSKDWTRLARSSRTARTTRIRTRKDS